MPSGVHLNPRTGWHLDRALVARIKRYAESEGRPQVAVVTEALTEYLDKRETDKSEDLAR